MEPMRLQKFIAEAGVASRRKAEEMIAAGRIKINGTVVTEMGTKVNGNDRVEVDGKGISLDSKKVYILLNKPVGYITTARDQFGRPTVLDLVKEPGLRLYPVGRLDYDTSGLLILTNDGEFTYRMTHPSREIEKVYKALVKGVPGEKEIESFSKGMKIEDYTTAPGKLEVIEVQKDKALVEITIHEGRNRQVRKMCSAIGCPVISLKRVEVGGLVLGTLKEGKWRYLTPQEIELLNRKLK